MGQQEVYKVLKKSNIPLSKSQIAKILKWTDIRTSSVLRRLIHFEEVKTKEVSCWEARELGLKTNRRMLLYFIEDEN